MRHLLHLSTSVLANCTRSFIKVLLVTLLFIATSLANAQAQSAENIFELGYGMPSPIHIERGSPGNGGVNVMVTILQNNSSSYVTPGVYTFATIPGLYMENPVVNDYSGIQVGTASLNAEADTITLTIFNNTTPNIFLTFYLWAGQCFQFNSDASIPNVAPFSLTNTTNLSSPTTVSLSNNNITIDIGSYLTYLPAPSDEQPTVLPGYSVTTATPDGSSNVTFKYYITNNNTVAFNNAAFSFQENKVGNAYNITAVSFYVKFATGPYPNVWIRIDSVPNLAAASNEANSNNNSFVNNNTFANDNSFVTAKPIVVGPIVKIADPNNPGSNIIIPINLNNLDTIRIDEHVNVNSCLFNGPNKIDGEDDSDPIILWGNAAYDLCGEPLTPVATFISNPGTAPLLSVQGFYSDLACFGDAPPTAGGGRDEYVVITNTGNDTAKHVLLRLNNAIPNNINIPINTKYTSATDNINTNNNTTIYRGNKGAGLYITQR